ncbi:formamidase [Planosporangium mesophilum]|uniref:Putative acetamidase/formamidase n=1 Tax=Planosporangium mesophilum TaxID=689768 RepID=A0A8J3X2N3_9ACTN|nr:formamidase [Planosporangium mesophilum]NJC86702.1 acetamidase/formamidase family protein [Planosporangium mesophilum]GII25672.1 putative acetamidase/formamidase [Planosporangium mesophilum]
MPEVLFRLDPTRKFTEQEKIGHNRWHPDIPPVATVRPGQSFRVHCREWFDGWMRNDDSADDIRDAPLSRVHCLSGPFAVEGADPGDLLVVDILDVGPMEEDSGPLAGMGWGYTGIFHKRNGGGFLTDEFPDAYKAIWDFRGQKATSRHIPGVTFTGMIHSGLMGTAPSADLLAKWNEREAALIARDPHRVPPLALPPEPRDAILGTLSGEDFERVANEAARTAPPRENGGNQDIKNLTKGTRAFYPVYVPGAKFSVGDLHFSQGDGEITFCGAIEMGGYIDFHMDLIKDGMRKYGVSENTIFLPGNTDPQYCQWLAFSGISVTEEGEQRYLDSQLAYKRACLHAIEYLTKFGYTGEQIYLLLGAAPIEGRFSGVVDIPNSCATIYIPTEIFDFDVRPTAGGTTRVDAGRGAPKSSF